jgi:hypothetical protein
LSVINIQCCNNERPLKKPIPWHSAISWISRVNNATSFNFEIHLSQGYKTKGILSGSITRDQESVLPGLYEDHDFSVLIGLLGRF